MHALLNEVSTSPENTFKNKALSFVQFPESALISPGLDRVSAGAAIVLDVL